MHGSATVVPVPALKHEQGTELNMTGTLLPPYVTSTFFVVCGGVTNRYSVVYGGCARTIDKAPPYRPAFVLKHELEHPKRFRDMTEDDRKEIERAFDSFGTHGE